jgi:hypothetical protein
MGRLPPGVPVHPDLPLGPAPKPSRTGSQRQVKRSASGASDDMPLNAIPTGELKPEMVSVAVLLVVLITETVPLPEFVT